MSMKETIFSSAETTECVIAEIEKEIKAIAAIPESALDYTTAMGVIRHLQQYKGELTHDLTKFDRC